MAFGKTAERNAPVPSVSSRDRVAEPVTAPAPAPAPAPAETPAQTVDEKIEKPSRKNVDLTSLDLAAVDAPDEVIPTREVAPVPAPILAAYQDSANRNITKAFPSVPADAVDTLVRAIKRAARESGHGVPKIPTPTKNDDGTMKVRFIARTTKRKYNKKDETEKSA